MKTDVKLIDVIELIKRKNYSLYTEPKRLNITGIRSVNRTVNLFNDLFWVFWMEGTEQKSFSMIGTTDPGLTYLKKLLNPKGTGILVPGQYDYKLGLHKGKIKAFVQDGPVKLYRDKNKDDIMDMNPNTIDSGYYGVNIHPTSVFNPKFIGPWSAACQVPQNKEEFAYLIALAEEHKKLYGNKFKYTLLLEEEINLFFKPEI
ncbi:MAG: hypothetical protein V1773_17115 [bacterium]